MDTVPTHGDKPKRTLKVLIPFDATMEQIEQAVEMLFGPDPDKPKPTDGLEVPTPADKPKPSKVLISPDVTLDQIEEAVRQMRGHPTPEPETPDPSQPSD
jgi:hypothetical protein